MAEKTEKTITASFIIEILGRPKEHVSDTLEKLTDELEKEKGITIINKKLYEPKKYEIKKEEDEEAEEEKQPPEKNKQEIKIENELFTSFADIEADFENMEALLTIAFKYMPSNIEISAPENFVMKNTDFSGLLSAIILRLHKYDELTKKLSYENKIIVEKFNEEIQRLREKQNKNSQ